MSASTQLGCLIAQIQYEGKRTLPTKSIGHSLGKWEIKVLRGPRTLVYDFLAFLSA